MAKDCTALQKSLRWCKGSPEYPGVREDLFFTAKTNIVSWPELPVDELGRPTSGAYKGSFKLKADACFNVIDINADKSQFTSEAQGEAPSQTQLNKFSAVHNGMGEEAAGACAYLNNTDNVYIFRDMRGRFRVIGSEMWPTKTTVAADGGQGATGTAATTISIEATDKIIAPFYEGEIVTEDGTINEEQTKD